MTEYLIPHPRPHSEKGVYNFYEWDDDKTYKMNLSKFGKEWGDYWEKQHLITYKINSLGYRMDEIEEIDQNNYIVTLGCSHTAGIGLPLEETWTHKISKHLGADLVNGGSPGTSNELILMNLIRILTNLKKPKLVVVAWTSIYRKLFWEKDKLTFHHADTYLSRSGFIKKENRGWFKDVKWENSYNDYLTNEEERYSSFNELKNQVIGLCKMKNVPLMMISLFEGYENYNDITTLLFPDDPDNIYNRARDIAHYGINSQNIIVRSLIKNYKNV